MSRFVVEFFLSQYSVLCFGKFPVANKFMDEKGGVSKFSVEKFLSQSAKEIRRGTL